MQGEPYEDGSYAEACTRKYSGNQSKRLRPKNMRELDCAVCAAKMERVASKVDGVKNVSVNFLTRRLTVEADDCRFDDVMKEIERVCRKIEPDCKIIG